MCSFVNNLFVVKNLTVMMSLLLSYANGKVMDLSLHGHMCITSDKKGHVGLVCWSLTEKFGNY